jgi:hypothetical protein
MRSACGLVTRSACVASRAFPQAQAVMLSLSNIDKRLRIRNVYRRIRDRQTFVKPENCPVIFTNFRLLHVATGNNTR